MTFNSSYGRQAECWDYEEGVKWLNMIMNKYTSKVIVDSKELISKCLKCDYKDKCFDKNYFVTYLDKNVD